MEQAHMHIYAATPVRPVIYDLTWILNIRCCCIYWLF